MHWLRIVSTTALCLAPTVAVPYYGNTEGLTSKPFAIPDAAVEVPIVGTATILYVNPSVRYADPSRVDSLLHAARRIVSQDSRIYGQDTPLTESFKLPKGPGLVLTIAGTRREKLTWRIMEDVVKGLQLFRTGQQEPALFTFEVRNQGEAVASGDIAYSNRESWNSDTAFSLSR